MPMTLAQFAELAEPGLDNIWHDALDPVEQQYQKLVNIRNLEKNTAKDAKMAGFGSLVAIDRDGGSITYDTAIEPVTRTYQWAKFGLGYQITEDFNDWDLYSQVELFERDLMRSSQDHVETYIAAIYNNATATTISTGFDGLALSSTAHTRLDGGATAANRPTTLTALSLASLSDASVHFDTLVNDRGRPVKAEMQTLLIVPNLRLTAVELLQSSMRPDTANNAVNAIAREGLTPFVSRYLTGTTFWSIIGNYHDINFFWAMKPTTSQDVDFDTDTIKRKVKQGYARGHGEWRGFYQGNS